jgi:hypothetical protein
MSIRQVTVTLAAIAALSPVISNATPERASAKACARAFATSIAAPGGAAPQFKLAYRADVSSTVSDYYPTEYTFALEARNPKTGVALARALCVTNAHGEVASISALPLDEKPALAAGL